MSTYFDYVMIPLQLLIVFFTIYYFTLSFFGLFGKKKETKIYTNIKRFALIVCAHNEERVIGELVENLRVLKYDPKLYDIYVVADNCQDQTAKIARDAGAIVEERFSQTGKGKGFALEWMFHRLFAMDKKYDAVCIFDADNLVHPDFLREMNSRLCQGEKVIQGYLDTKNPEDTWISAMFAISFWITNHVWHLAKYNIGLSCVLGGTGMCIDTQVLKKHGWGATCLTEDMEFTMKALMEGIPTTWAHDAIIYDEKPLTFKAAWNQRVRWAQGNFDVANRYIPKMLFKGIKEHNVLLLDGVIDMFQPYFMLISAFFLLSSYVYEFVPFYTNILYDVLPIGVWQVIGVGQYLFPMSVLIKIRASWKSWAYLLIYPVFIYSWMPITAIGWLRRNQHVWNHTLHTRAIGFNDVIIPEDVVHVGPKQVMFNKASK